METAQGHVTSSQVDFKLSFGTIRAVLLCADRKRKEFSFYLEDIVMLFNVWSGVVRVVHMIIFLVHNSYFQ